MKRLILTVLAAGAVGTAAAQECGEPMTLQRCLELGLEQNYDVRIIRNEQRISDNDATAANAGMLPSVDLTAGYSGALDNERTTPREGDAVTENGIYDQTFDAGVAVNWTLFDGFRIRTNYKRLQELQQMGALRTRITIEDFVATLTAEYYNYVQQTLRLSNFRYAVQLSRERLRITEERFKIGSFSRLDLLQARVDFNADSSKYMSQHELVTASRIRINELLANDDLNGRLSICDSLIEVNSTLEWDRLEAETRAANASLLLAGHDNTLAELDLKSIRSRFYPYLNLTAGYGYTYNRFGNGATQSRGTLGLNAGVKLGFTIFDGNRRREQRNARITIENTELTRQQLEQSLMANLSNFWQAYRNNLEVIQLETENLIAARENYDTGVGMCRPMYYDHPERDEAYNVPEQFMFGNDILATAVVEPVDSVTGLAARRIWFPEGRWYDCATGAMYEGGRTEELHYTLSENPWYARAGAILPMNPQTVKNLQQPCDTLVLTFIPGADGELVHYEDDGVSQQYATAYATTKVTKKQEGNTLRAVVAPREGTYAGAPDSRSFEMRFPATFPPKTVQVNGREIPYARFPKAGQWTYDAYTLAPVVYTDAAPCDRPLEVVLTFDDHAAAHQADLYGKSGVFKRCIDLTVEFKTEQGKTEPYLMLPKEYLNVSQCPNFILEDPGRIAGYLAAYEKNKAALFETTDKMTIIGENFKKRLRAQIGGVK